MKKNTFSILIALLVAFSFLGANAAIFVKIPNLESSMYMLSKDGLLRKLNASTLEVEKEIETRKATGLIVVGDTLVTQSSRRSGRRRSLVVVTYDSELNQIASKTFLLGGPGRDRSRGNDRDDERRKPDDRQKPDGERPGSNPDDNLSDEEVDSIVG